MSQWPTSPSISCLERSITSSSFSELREYRLNLLMMMSSKSEKNTSKISQFEAIQMHLWWLKK